MASTIKSSTTATTKKVAGKTVKTVVDETTVTSSSEVIALDKNKKKTLTLIADLVRLREAITDLEKEKQEATEAIYALMGWEKIKVGKSEKWVGVATKGTLNGSTKITISRQNRKEIDKALLETNFPEAYNATQYEISFTKLLTK
jgi:hypothetical protein